MKKRVYQTPQMQPEQIPDVDILTMSVGENNEEHADFGEFEWE